MAQKVQPHILITIGLVLLAGPAGIAATAYDYLKQGHYSPTAPPDKKVIFKQLWIAFFFLFFARAMLGTLPVDLAIPGLTMLNDWFPILAQALVGVIVTKRSLHKQNIYFTNKALWDSIDWMAALKELAQANFKEGLKVPKPAQATTPTTATSSTHQMTPASVSQSPIVVDQSSDKWRVKLIIFALIAGLLVLGYQYASKNPEQLMDRVNQVVEKYVEIEK